jgi:hypothetical protein
MNTFPNSMKLLPFETNSLKQVMNSQNNNIFLWQYLDWLHLQTSGVNRVNFFSLNVFLNLKILEKFPKRLGKISHIYTSKKIINK